MKLCLVCSSGGHLFQLYLLKNFWSKFDHFWVTFQADDSRSLLEDEKISYAYHPTNRNVINLIRNFFRALIVLKRERPDVVVSTGAGVAVPFIYAAKLLGIQTIYLESVTRVKGLSLSGKLVSPVVDHLLVQWPELAEQNKRARYAGRCL